LLRRSCLCIISQYSSRRRHMRIFPGAWLIQLYISGTCNKGWSAVLRCRYNFLIKVA
jgi:hypothetical protein